MEKPSIPKGTRDFSPDEMIKREYIFDVIRNVFKKYGYAPIETPAMENLSTLLGKYGEEGDKLLFKILNSGDFLRKTNGDDLKEQNSAAFAIRVSEKGLRYDLTVPFARYVVQHRNEIQFPFKRYQIQPVWRADRPQKGRYREFYQCDADVIGSDSLMNEIELIQIIRDVFQKLKIHILIKVNNRKILSGIAESIGCPERLTDVTVAIDKIEKTGLESVLLEMQEKGIPKQAISKLKPFLELKGTNSGIIEKIKPLLHSCETGMKGIEEMEKLFELAAYIHCEKAIELDLTLARGLNYYTGTIFEVKTTDTEIGSICGGGRYDNLTGIFGLHDVSGVGISFGADRIFDVLNELNAYPESVGSGSKVLLIALGEKEQLFCLGLLEKLHASGIPCELYPDTAKLKKQMTYANLKKIPFVLIVGEDELKAGSFSLRNMETGEQEILNKEDLIQRIK